MSAALQFDPRHELQVTRQCCEDSLLWFSRYFFQVRESIPFRVNWHHALICKALQDIYYGRVLNLIINVPPGSSKTELAVINFMAWSIAKNPRCRFLHLSYADTLVEENSSKTKDLIESEEYQALWGREIRQDSKAKKRWNIEIDGKRAGGCYAVALGGTITGFRAGHMAEGFQGAIVIDDPMKPEDIFSPTRTHTANRKLENTVRSRKASPDTPVILIMQRLGVDDPTGFALDGKIGGLKFEHIKIPALDENGDSYWPYKEPVADLLKWKDANPYTFAGQMQQEPTVLGGTIFKGDWWQFWEELPPLMAIKMYADTAMKTKERNDFSVFQVWGLSTNGQIYLLDQIRGKWESPELERQARAFWAKWKSQPMGDKLPQPFQLLVEDKSSGTGLIQSLKSGPGAIPIDGIPRDIDKLTRAMSSAPSVAAGNVWLPDPRANPTEWLADYLAEFAAFTGDSSDKHDDQCDPTMDAIHDMILGNVDFYGSALD